MTARLFSLLLIFAAPHIAAANIEQSDATWEAAKARRLEWWSFQPIQSHRAPPKTKEALDHPVDRFIHKTLESKGLRPAGEADWPILRRRLAFVLTGLPPSTDAPTEPAKYIDQLLDSPQFGEHWARHWMDWMRYADSHGSEGDPMIPNSEAYRNYLIRALNADIPYDQMVSEHVAGDLLPKPRTHAQLGLNESALGTAHYRFVLHGFAPTDAHDEHIRYNDDAIDTLTKAFLGLTVSCARCHNHKFDPISQKDYYALFGIVSNGRPAQIPASDPALSADARQQMDKHKDTLRKALAEAWLKSADTLATQLVNKEHPRLREAIHKAGNDANSALRPWARLQNVKGDLTTAWNSEKTEFQESQKRLDARRKTQGALGPAWFSAAARGYAQWPKAGTGFGKEAARAGSFNVLTNGDRILDRILPGGAYTHLHSTKDGGFLTTPRFQFTEGDVWIRAIGDQSTLRYVVWGYPRRGTVYPKGSAKKDNFTWQRWGTKYWAGESGYLEATTSRDAPVEAGGSERSWFGVTEALVTAPGEPTPRDEPAEATAPLFLQTAPKDTAALAKLYAETLRSILHKWAVDKLTDAEANFLNTFVRAGWLSTTQRDVPGTAEDLAEYRRIEGNLRAPQRVPGLVDGQPFDQPLLLRGDHKKPGPPVPPRFLEAIDDTPYAKDRPARLQLAKDLLREDNPLVARVIVNRIWHHVFGEGLVATTDNFGRLGEEPSHPELLDHLATEFRRNGWSIKWLVRHLTTSRTFQMHSQPSEAAKQSDPGNRLLSHARVRRLPAESIRDAMLAASGRISLGNPGAGGREKPNSTRRSVYQQIRRNSLNPLLTIFDAPAPATCTGTRSSTNVPAQSLALLNNSFIHGLATALAQNADGDTPAAQTQSMFRAAFGRDATDDEIQQVQAYLVGADQQHSDALEKLNEAQTALSDARKQLAAILEPAREQILANRGKDDAPTPSLPKPTVHFDFTQSHKDQDGNTAKFLGSARLRKGGLHTKGGFAMTSSLPFEIGEKTLTARVQLDNIRQSGGGVITLQTRSGTDFDSIVFGEQTPGHWMSGSEFFRRTKDVSGPREDLADKEPIHIAATYAADGTVTLYRNGQPYGQPYRTGLRKFAKGSAILAFGIRHGTRPDPKRTLQGNILEASLFTRALRADAVAALAGASNNYVSQEDLLAALNPAQSEQKARLELSIEALEKQIAENQPTAKSQQSNSLQDLAMALFNMKEFIYLR